MSAAAGAVTIREAVIEDLDQITEIGLASFPLDPLWNYRYTYRKQYPDIHYVGCKQRWAEWLAANQTRHCTVLVAEGPSNENSLVKRIQAFSIWKMPSHFLKEGEEHNMRPPTYSDRADANYAHTKTYRERIIEAEQKLFEPRYGTRQIDLIQLVTHPDYFRRGLARKLVEKGQQIASERRLAVGVFASPMGKIVYEKCGFQVFGNVVVKVEGETEALEFPAMGWEPRNFRIRG